MLPLIFIASGEQVIAVECVSIEEASRRFISIGRHDLSELYRLAATDYTD